MKRVTMSLVLVLTACGGEEAEPEVAPAAEPATAEVVLPAMDGPPPAHGGTVVMAGQRPVEVVADEEGAIKAYYLGEPPASPQDARVTVRVPGQDGQVRPVLLTWDPAESSYQGVLRGAPPAPGPLEIVLVLGTETLRGSAPTFVLAQPGVRAANAVARVPGAVGQQVAPATAVVLDRPQPPNVEVRLQQPPPPPTIVVQQPPPPNVRVVVGAPPPPNARVVVAAPPPPNPRVVVAAPPPPPRPRVVVAAPPPPPRPRVVVAAPPPASARVVAAPPAARPAPPPRVIAAPPGDDHPGRGHARGHDRDDDHPGRGHARGHRERDDDD